MSGDALDLDALAALEQAATPGPWEAVAGAFGDPANGPDHMRVVREGWSNAHDPEHTVARMEYDQQNAADAALIAALRNAAPALIAAARDRSVGEPGALDDDDHIYCEVCGRPCLYGSRHSTCGDYAMRVEAERDAARVEMHNRELHHFETEQENAALRGEVAALRAALTDAIEELVECRSFISVETRHYPTVTGITEKIQTLRAVLTTGADQ